MDLTEGLRNGGFLGLAGALHDDRRVISKVLSEAIEEWGAVSGESIEGALIDLLGLAKDRWNRDKAHRKYLSHGVLNGIKSDYLSALVSEVLKRDRKFAMSKGSEVFILPGDDILYKLRGLMLVYFAERERAVDYVGARMNVSGFRIKKGIKSVCVSFSEQE